MENKQENKISKSNEQSLGEKGISAFVTALGIRGACNNFEKIEYDDVFDFNKNTLKTMKFQ